MYYYLRRLTYQICSQCVSHKQQEPTCMRNELTTNLIISLDRSQNVKPKQEEFVTRNKL